MTNPNPKLRLPEATYSPRKIPNQKVPTRDDIFTVPMPVVKALTEIAPKIQRSGAWWAVTGDLAECFQDTHVRPTLIEILTDKPGLEPITTSLTEYSPKRMGLVERRLQREADIEAKMYPIYERSERVELTVDGVRVLLDADYQMKVGDWEWGDAFYFEPIFTYVVGVRIPLISARLRSDIYFTLGWLDRVRLLSDAYERAHAAENIKPGHAAHAAKRG